VRADRVVMVSYDGVGADLAWQWIDDGVAELPDGLRTMAEDGVSARRVRMVNPTLTAVNHWALSTGRDAAGTGIVSNDFRRPGMPIDERVSGFLTTTEAPTLWRAARAEGLKVISILWVGVAAGETDGAVLWPGWPLTPSEVIELEPSRAGSTGEVPSSDGLQPRLWSVDVPLPNSTPESTRFFVALVDSTPDGLPRYDTVATRPAESDDWSYSGELEWFEHRFEAQTEEGDGPRTWSSWSKVLHVDRINGAVRLYRGAVCRLKATPREFEDRLTAALGPWPGQPDDMKVADWWLDLHEGVDLDTYSEQAERLDRYLDRMAEWVLAEEDPDLLFTYTPTPDEFQHSSLIADQLQWAWSPGRELAAREGLKRLGRSVDRSVQTLWRALDPERDALVVVSDHGHLPIFEMVRPNRALAEHGLVQTTTESGATRLAGDTPMVAVTSGASFHLYLNLEGREPGGVVPRTEVQQYLNRAARVLADLESEGRPVVERIFTREQAAEIGLGSPNTGDLVVFLAPGFATSGDLEGPVLEPSRYYGQHGYLASYDGMCGMLFACGAGLERRRLGEVPVTAIAPTVARWLGFDLMPAGESFTPF
jgi:predicted AlkP superfamily phosphohydrolase/phosphomutase